MNIHLVGAIKKYVQKTNLFLLFRFLIISVLYLTMLKIFGTDVFIKIQYFAFFLGIYLISIFACFKSTKKRSILIRICINIIFLILFLIETIRIYFLMRRAPGEAGFAYFYIIQYLPMKVLFIIWLFIDLKKNQGNKNCH